MSSRYPNQLDGIDNLPTIRDNLTIIGGQVINNLRDSVLSIESALGINPQGTFADLSSRLALIIAADGSLNKQALQNIGGVFGPIRDADIDPNAKIAETKIALNYPTAVLRDLIAILDARNAGLIELILSAQASIQEHITRAIGAHRATAISTDVQSSAVKSSTATIKINQSNIQLALQELYSGHINFNPGINSDQLTLTNSPHQANQVYYDNRNTELPTNSVQGAIDNLFLKGDDFITDHQRQLHSNGIQRRIEAVDTNNSSGVGRGRIIFSAFNARIQYPNSNADTSIFVDIPAQQGANVSGVSLVITNADGTKENIPIGIDDDVQITDPLGNQYALLPITDLRINAVTDPNTNITTNYLIGFDVFYNPDIFSAIFTSNGINETSPVLQIICSIYKKIDVQGNRNALNCIARVLKPNSVAEPNLSSNVSEIQVAHPNAATIISQGFNPSALGRRADGYFDRNFASILTFIVDGTKTYKVQIVPNSPVDITLDTCVAKANIEFLKQNIPLTAYRLNEEMVISHNWPDDIFIAGARHTIRIVSGGGVDASMAAGFTYTVNTTIYGTAGNSFIVNGIQRSTFRIKMPPIDTALGKSGFTIFGNVVVFNDTANNPILAGVRVGDIINLQGLTSVSTQNLDGIRRISNLTSNTITVDGDPYPVDIILTDSATLVIYSNTVSFDGIAHRFQTDFAGLDPNLSQNIIVQVFINSAGELDFHERLIYPNAATRSGTAFGGPVTLSITNLAGDEHGIYVVDCSRGLEGSVSGTNRLISLQFDNKKRVFATFGCQSSPNDGYTISTSLHGPPVNITGSGYYNLFDETGLEFITIHSIKAFNLLSDTILNTIPVGKLLTYVLPIVKFENINEFEGLLLCNAYYNSQINQIPILDGDLALFDKRYSGTLGAEQLRDDVIEKYISGPFGETRGDGVASGLFVPSDPSATQNITNDKVVYVNGGVVYVQGVRYEISSQQIYVDPATLDISQYGNDGYFPGTGTVPNGDGTFKNSYIRYYVFVDHDGRLQTTSSLNLPASLPFVPLAKVVLTVHGLLNNAPNIISVNVVDFRLFIGRLDDQIEITVSPIIQQSAHFHSLIAATEYVDNMRYNDVITNTNVHTRPVIIRMMEGTYQEATTVDVPPFVTIKGENAHAVRMRPPVNLLGRNVAGNPQIDDTVNNQYIFNINVLPEGISVKIENICFDLNTSTTIGSPTVPGANKVGAIKATWFNNSQAIVNIPTQLANMPSIIDIDKCLFILDGPAKSIGITTVFSVATPFITGGKARFSYAYSLQFHHVYFDTYAFYHEKPAPIPASTGQTTPPPPPTVVQPATPSIGSPTAPPEPGPNSTSSPPGSIDLVPKAPFSPEDAIFTDVNAPANFNHGGIMNITNNTFLITDGYGSICVDRFYDTTTLAGFLSVTPIPVSNTRMKGFKITGNSFEYRGKLLNQSLLSPAINGIIPTTTAVDTTTGTPGQEALRQQIYDMMIHKDLRGHVPSRYSTDKIYPDPKDGYGIPDGYWIPPAGGKLTEFIVIANNTPTGINMESNSPVGFLSDTQDSIARDEHGGGIKFGTFTIPPTGLPIILDRSTDWHDRYLLAYANNLLTDSSALASTLAIKNRIYTNTAPTPIQNLWSGVSFVSTGTGGALNAQSPDQAMADYGASKAAHGFVHGYTARLSGDLISIKHPLAAQLPGWSNIKYIGTFSFTSDFANNISLIVMPNGALAALHSGLQNPNPAALAQNTKLVQTTDSFPAGTTSSSDPSRSGAQAMTISLVIQYSPKLNVLTASSYNADTGLNTLDNSGKGYGKL